MTSCLVLVLHGITLRKPRRGEREHKKAGNKSHTIGRSTGEFVFPQAGALSLMGFIRYPCAADAFGGVDAVVLMRIETMGTGSLGGASVSVAGRLIVELGAPRG